MRKVRERFSSIGKGLNKEDLWAIGGFFVLLLLLYGLPLITVYYFADEAGGPLLREHHWNELIRAVLRPDRATGRPITKFIFILSGKIITSGLAGLQFMRFMQFIASFSTAVLLYTLLRKRKVPTIWAGILILFIWSQPAIQIYHVYASLLPYLLGIMASYLAVAVLFWTRPSSRRSLLATFVLAVLLLMVGWMTFQVAPFAGLALVAFYALTAKEDVARSENKRLLLFFAALILSMVIYLAGYRLILELYPVETYVSTQFTFSFLSGDMPGSAYIKILDPRNYLGVFEWWNYLIPVPKLELEQYYLATGLSALAWLVIFSWSFLLELAARPRRYVISKYLLATAAILLTLVPNVADDFSQRQHMYIATVPALILCLGYCLFVLSRRYQFWENHRRWIAGFGLLLLLLVVLGAQANVNRGLVQPAARFYTFVRSEIVRQGDEPYDGILVVRAFSTCPHEPCSGFFKRRLGIAARNTTSSSIFYKRMLVDLGKGDDVPVGYTRELDPTTETANKLIINNQILAEILKR